MTPSTVRRLRREWALPIGIATTIAFLALGKAWLADPTHPAGLALAFAWLFGAILVCAFAVVRHAEALAVRLGEPYGTLVLTLTMSGMEMMMISAVMLTGHGGATLARDTMLAIVMLVLNGLVGACLLVGGLRYHEQTYNLYSANAFLGVILPLSVFGLVLPALTITTPGPTLSPLQSTFLIFMSIALYGVFLGIQTIRHRNYFVAPDQPAGRSAPVEAMHGDAPDSVRYHVALLLAYALPIVLLAKQIALPIDFGISVLRAPVALGGLIVAVLILSPESMAAVRAALGNQIQRSINVALGTALSTISLTIPAVLTIGFATNQTIVLGLDPVDTVLLLLTLVVSMLTFALARTNVLSGAVHILLFLAYLMLIFEK
jgi:Ca2+:H+ antiporter